MIGGLKQILGFGSPVARVKEEPECEKEAMLASLAGVTLTPDMGFGDYGSRLAKAKRDFKHGLSAPTSAEEMSRIYKDTAHGSADSGAYAGIPPSAMISSKTLRGAGAHSGGYVSATGPGKSISETIAEADEMRRKQAADHEASEMKRLSKAFVKGIGEEMTNVFANAAIRGEACEFAGEVLKRLMVAAENNGINIHELLEEIEMTEEEKSKEALALENLAKAITEYWAGPDYELDQDQFSLSGPVSLTILRAPSESHKSGYGKKAHIGGEEFTGAKAYLGKRGHIICCFKPVGVEDYINMEMPLGDCFSQLAGFQKHFVEQGFNVQFQAIRDAKNAEKQAADLEQFSSKYSDFGSF